MDNLDPNLTPQQEPESQEEPKPSYTPASPQKRLLAWIGVVAMVLLTLAFAYVTATGKLFWM